MELILDIALKVNTSLAKGSKIFEANSYVCRNYRGKTGRGAYFGTSSILNRVKESFVPNKKINRLLNTVSICLGEAKNCLFIRRQVKDFQVKFWQILFDGDTFDVVNDELQVLIPY